MILRKGFLTNTFLLTSLCFLYLLLNPHHLLAHSEVQIIEMTKDGFVPQEVTVDQNSSVIFLNKDNQARWPASNTHPTHEVYPDFDPRRPIAPNESWSLKNPQSGEWRYHDHLLPHLRGIIKVTTEADSKTPTPTPENQPSSVNSTFLGRLKDTFLSLITKIQGLLGRKKKLTSIPPLPSSESFKTLPPKLQTEQLRQIAEHYGAPKSWQFFKETFKDEAGSSGNIHDLAHLAGILLYESQGFESIKSCSSQFAFGCFHGFLDKAFAKSLDLLPDAEKACSRLGASGTGPVSSCIHGIGHGIASFYSTADLKKALIACRRLTSGNEYCFDGVFMEFVRSAPDSFYSNDNPLYPCNKLEEEYGYSYSFACGRNQPSLLMSRFKFDFNQVVQTCLASSSKPLKEGCFDALGFSLASTTDPKQIITGCQKLTQPEFINRCAKAAAGELVFQEVPGWEESSKVICNSFPQVTTDCLTHIDRLVKEYKRVRKINFKPPQENEDSNSYLRRQIKICYDTAGADSCYKQLAQVLYQRFGLSQTLNLLKTNENYPEVYARCHEVTHYLSRHEYQRLNDISLVYTQCDSTCHGGCYHGTLEAYLQEKTNQSGFDLNRHFAQICGQASDYSKPVLFNECLHGMGHAAMFITDMELKTSLTLCDTISDQKDKERCFTGVFMENSSSSTSLDHASRYVKSNDPFYPCNVLEERYQPLCWQYQSSYFSIIFQQDWPKVANLCLQIPSQYQDRCFRTIGTNQVGFTPSLETMKKNCDLMPTDHFKDICIAGVVSSLSYRFVGNSQKMIDFCSLVDAPYQPICFKQMGTGLLDWDNNHDTAKKECQKIPLPQGQSWCTGAI